ncbi:MAG: response regulator [Nitrospirae bacterium]|nr:response regulator [Nitrospirota bacterium]
MNKILIVDDEPLLRRSLSKAVHSNSVEVMPVSTGEDALVEIGSCFYSLCFLDIHLSGTNGIDIMKKIKEISPKTKVVIMSAHEITDDMKKEIEKSAYLFVPKPFDLSHVKAIVSEVLGDNYSNPNFFI